MKIGMVTVGQSPRSDVVAEIRDILGQVEIVERGCLDGLTKDRIKSLKPEEGEPFLITLLRDGSSVQVSRGKTMNLLQQRIKELENEDVTLIALLCTGDFNIKSKKLLIEPGKLIRKLIQGMLTEEKRLGVIIPSLEQIEQTKKKWGDVNPVIVAASPYGHLERVEEAAKILQAKNVDLTALDCIGYTGQMKQKVKEITGNPVVLACTIVARLSKELC
jgi:protein AroM